MKQLPLARLWSQKCAAGLLLFAVLNLLFMHHYVFHNHYMEDVLLAYSFANNFLMVVFDVSAVFLLFLLLTWGRMKCSALLTFLTTWAWSFANVFYVRFFNQYLSLSAMGQTSQLTDQAVVNSMMAGFQLTDLFYPLILAIFMLCYRRVKPCRITRHWLFRFLLVPVMAFAGTFAVYSVYHVAKADTRGNWHLYKKRMVGMLSTDSRNSFPNTTRFMSGSVRVLAGEVHDVFHQLELTSEQRKQIAREAADLSQRVTGHERDTTICNVVFVVLESFLSSPIDAVVDGKEITPFLNALKRNDDTYYNGHVMPNITIGESGDGQFLYMTGLLPLRDKLTVGEAKSLQLPALPRIMKEQLGTQYAEIVMPSPPQVWEQEQMNVVYGLDKMYCNRDVLGKSMAYLNDEQVFTLAMQSDIWQRQPFFWLVLNYSTHQPYRSPVDSSLTLSDATLPNGYKNYLIACHYADLWLEKFFADLKQKGIYDNSLIVIAADHHAHLDALGMGDRITKELPLFIVHGGIDKKTAWTGTMNQLDVFTTLLDVMALKTDWHGLGHSILKPTYQNSVTEHAWTLSEWIVKGKYFNKTAESK